MSDNNKLNDIIRTSLDSIRSMVDTNTVIGEPINTANGTTVIPVSKVFVGFASGGIDYLGKNAVSASAPKTTANNFGGGGGTGLTVSPVAFLVIDKDGGVKLLNVNEPTKQTADPVSQIVGLLERSPELIERVKAIFAKKDAAASTAEEYTAEAEEK